MSTLSKTSFTLKSEIQISYREYFFFRYGKSIHIFAFGLTFFSSFINVLTFLIALFNFPSYAIDLKFYEGDEYWEKISSLNWTYGPSAIKHLSQGSIKISADQQAVTGDDAKQVMYWWNGEQFNIDVLVVTSETGDYTDYTYLNEGYVKLDDWKDVNPDKFIKELRSGLKDSNKKRIAKTSKCKCNSKPYIESFCSYKTCDKSNSYRKT